MEHQKRGFEAFLIFFKILPSSLENFVRQKKKKSCDELFPLGNRRLFTFLADMTGHFKYLGNYQSPAP